MPVSAKIAPRVLLCLNESPSEKEGKYVFDRVDKFAHAGLNESPSEKEGKSHSKVACDGIDINASMKALLKRKGNSAPGSRCRLLPCLNESPSEKEGKCAIPAAGTHAIPSLNESPSEKEGKSSAVESSPVENNRSLNESPSEKEGKCRPAAQRSGQWPRLNESPSEKEGKFLRPPRKGSITY